MKTNSEAAIRACRVLRQKSGAPARREAHWAMVALVCLLAGTASAQIYNFSIPLPQGVDFNDVVLEAMGTLTIDPSADIQGGSHTARVVNLGSTMTRVGPLAKTGDVLSVAPTRLEIARVNGDVISEGDITRLPETVVTGTVSPRTSIGRSVGPALHVEFPLTSMGSVSVFPGTTQSLSPGRYRTFKLLPLATIHLRSGTYYFDSYLVDPLATLSVDESAGPVKIFVSTAMSHMGGFQSKNGGKVPNVFVGYFGVLPVHVGGPFSGTLIAPNAQITLGTTTHTGTFLGKDVDVLPSAVVRHRPTDIFGIGNGNAIAPTPLVPPIASIPDPSRSPSFGGTLVMTGPDQGYYANLHYLAPDPAKGITEAKFCDENEKPVPAPTEAELNAPPLPGSMCRKVAANTTQCPVVPDPQKGSCNVDSDCGPDFLCAAQCSDTHCTEIRHVCGKPSASCAGLPLDNNCQEYRICAREGAVGKPNPAKLAAALAPQTTPAPSATISPAQKDAVPAYQLANVALCNAPLDASVTTQDGSNKPAEDGSQEWGVFFTPISDFGITPVKSSNGVGELTLHGTAGVAMGGVLLKNHVEVLSTNLSATVDDCGVTLTATVKFLGQAVAAWTPSAAENLHLATQNDDSIGTPGLDADRCKGARKATKDTIAEVRKSNLFAREIYDYYQTNGLTPALCSEIEREAPNPEVDPSTCTDLGIIPVAKRIDILNAWKKEYDGKTQAYLNFAKALHTSRQAIQVSSTAHVFDTPQAYHVKIFDQDFPIGPITLNIAVEGYGSWNISGGIQFGLGVDGNFSGATDLLSNTLNGQSPRAGDIRAFAGPVITPAAAVGILAFAGVGIPGVSIGIEGRIDLLNIKVPTGLVVAAMRLSEPDTRNRSGTQYSGPLTPGLEPAVYRWATGFSWGADLNLSELNGELDLAARLHFLFFSKTFRMKLFDWPGFTQNFTLIGGGSSNPMKYSGDYGKQADAMAYTEIPAIVNPPILSNSGAPVPTCSVIIK